MDKHLQIINEAFSTDIKACASTDDRYEWARLGFYVAYHLYGKIRKWRFKVGEIRETSKADGSPTTPLEVEMERFAKNAVAKFHAPTVFQGEELGRDLNDGNYLFVIDPIDGTRSFLSGFDTYSITLSIIKERIPLFSLVCVPASGDVFYRIGSEKSMVFQIPCKGEEVELFAIPFIDRPNEGPILVNLHPSRFSLPYLERLFDMWYNDEISLLKSVSGSPSLLMIEAAKSASFYVNTWEQSPTRPYDLIPALHIINASNCQALRRDGKQVDAWNHQGIYVVGPTGRKLNLLLNTLPGV